MLRLRSLVSLLFAGCTLLAAVAPGQQTPKATLETSETLFTVVTALNACGYDQELAASDPLRAQVRAEVAKAAHNSDRARTSLQDICVFYRDHAQADSARTLAQYVSLALNLGDAPAFTPTAKEADLPPDATYVLGFVPLLQRFYINADLHQIWKRHEADYSALVEKFSPQISNMLLTTDVYLKMPVSGYVGRRMVVYLEPMAAPGQVNSRNYGADYYMVVSPEHGTLRIDPIRHTYLHFTLDPLIAKRGSTMKRLEPLLETVKTAPMDEWFKNDITLMVNESVIRAIEARQDVKGRNKDAEAARDQKARKAAQEGFILTPYFEQQLAAFERVPEGFQDAFPDWLHALDVPHERKLAAEITFAGSATPETLQEPAHPRQASLLGEAEKRMAAGELKRARELAQQALEQKKEDPGQALFILARIASQDKDMASAQSFFEQALRATREPRILAWSNIYLGRIYDLQAERDKAVEHYRAALTAGDSSPTTRAAAERGIAQPYEPPSARTEDAKQE